MEKYHLVKTGSDLLTFDGLRSAVESAASSPKIAAGIGAGTASMGLMAKLEMINSLAGTISLCAGAITACLVLVIQAIKIVRVWRAWDPNRVAPKGEL